MEIDNYHKFWWDENDMFDILNVDEKKCWVDLLLMVRKIVPQVLSFLTADEYTSAYQSSWKCSQCTHINDEEISKAVFGDTNDGSRLMCYVLYHICSKQELAYKQH